MIAAATHLSQQEIEGIIGEPAPAPAPVETPVPEPVPVPAPTPSNESVIKQCPKCRLLFSEDKTACPICGGELVIHHQPQMAAPVTPKTEHAPAPAPTPAPPPKPAATAAPTPQPAAPRTTAQPQPVQSNYDNIDPGVKKKAKIFEIISGLILLVGVNMFSYMIAYHIGRDILYNEFGLFSGDGRNWHGFKLKYYQQDRHFFVNFCIINTILALTVFG